jgi:hypothetical protein
MAKRAALAQLMAHQTHPPIADAEHVVCSSSRYAMVISSTW